MADNDLSDEELTTLFMQAEVMQERGYRTAMSYRIQAAVNELQRRRYLERFHGRVSHGLPLSEDAKLPSDDVTAAGAMGDIDEAEQHRARANDNEGPFSIGQDRWPGIAKLIEECGEVAQIAGKLIATGGRTDHWSGLDLGEELESELGDVLAAISFVLEHNPLNVSAVYRRRASKLDLFNSWHVKPIEITLPADTTRSVPFPVGFEVYTHVNGEGWRWKCNTCGRKDVEFYSTADAAVAAVQAHACQGERV